MSALGAAAQRRFKKWGAEVSQNWRVANGDTIYVGSFCGLPGAVGLTSRRGYVTTYRDTQQIQWVGIAKGSPFNLSTSGTIVGNTSPSGGNPVVEVTTDAGPGMLEQYTVTGVSAQTDVYKAVYASNDNDLTLTASQSPAIGRVLYWWSSTTADVMIYGYLAAIVI